MENGTLSYEELAKDRSRLYEWRALLIGLLITSVFFNVAQFEGPGELKRWVSALTPEKTYQTRSYLQEYDDAVKRETAAVERNRILIAEKAILEGQLIQLQRMAQTVPANNVSAPAQSSTPRFDAFMDQTLLEEAQRLRAAKLRNDLLKAQGAQPASVKNNF